MSNDYLWDRTGKPDPEIQQLEEVLGTLRYQPRPLNIPAGFEVERAQSFFRRSAPRLAIAATIVMLLVGLGLWFGLQRLQTRQRPEVVKSVDAAQPNPLPSSNNEARDSAVAVSSPEREQKSVNEPRRQRLNPSLPSRNPNRLARNAVKTPQFTEQQIKEAEAAKNQLLLALRMASAKLNFAQRKTQDLNQREPVHNQHPIG